MRKLLLLVLLISCNTKKKETKVPTYIPLCDTLSAKIKYIKGAEEKLDTACLIIRCGTVDSANLSQFVKISSMIVKLSNDSTISPTDITWSAVKPRK